MDFGAVHQFYTVHVAAGALQQRSHLGGLADPDAEAPALVP